VPTLVVWPTALNPPRPCACQRSTGTGALPVVAQHGRSGGRPLPSAPPDSTLLTRPCICSTSKAHVRDGSFAHAHPRRVLRRVHACLLFVPLVSLTLTMVHVWVMVQDGVFGTHQEIPFHSFVDEGQLWRPPRRRRSGMCSSPTWVVHARAAPTPASLRPASQFNCRGQACAPASLRSRTPCAASVALSFGRDQCHQPPVCRLRIGATHSVQLPVRVCVCVPRTRALGACASHGARHQLAFGGRAAPRANAHVHA